MHGRQGSGRLPKKLDLFAASASGRNFASQLSQKVVAERLEKYQALGIGKDPIDSLLSRAITRGHLLAKLVQIASQIGARA